MRWFFDEFPLPNRLSQIGDFLRYYPVMFVVVYYAVGWMFYGNNSDELFRIFIRLFRRFVGARYETLTEIDYLVLAVTRDPATRCVSGYLDKFCTVERRRGFVDRVVKALGRDSVNEISFADFLQYLENSDIDKVNGHWRRQTHLLEKFVDYPQFGCVRIESFEEDLRSRLDYEVRHSLPRRNVSPTAGLQEAAACDMTTRPSEEIRRYREERDGFPPSRCFLTDRTLAQINEIYSEDYDFLRTVGLYDDERTNEH